MLTVSIHSTVNPFATDLSLIFFHLGPHAREQTLKMSTEPGETRNNFARDMQVWGPHGYGEDAHGREGREGRRAGWGGRREGGTEARGRDPPSPSLPSDEPPSFPFLRSTHKPSWEGGVRR